MKLQAAEEALVELLGKHDQAVSSRIARSASKWDPTAPLLIRSLREGLRRRLLVARILGEIRDGRATRCSATPSGTRSRRPLRAVWALGMIATVERDAGEP